MENLSSLQIGEGFTLLNVRHLSQVLAAGIVHWGWNKNSYTERRLGSRD